MPRPRHAAATAAWREIATALFFLGLAGIANRPLALDLWRTSFTGPDPMPEPRAVHHSRSFVPIAAGLNGDRLYEARLGAAPPLEVP